MHRQMMHSAAVCSAVAVLLTEFLLAFTDVECHFQPMCQAQE